jgi:hypothetical protein
MPAKSKAQQRLMAAAEHGADFPAAKKLRRSMTQEQLHDFAAGSMAGKPEHAPHPHRNLGAHLKAPKAGEYVTEHHRGAKKR